MFRISNFDNTIQDLNDQVFILKGMLEIERVSETKEVVEKVVEMVKKLQDASIQDLMEQ